MISFKVGSTSQKADDCPLVREYVYSITSCVNIPYERYPLPSFSFP